MVDLKMREIGLQPLLDVSNPQVDEVAEMVREFRNPNFIGLDLSGMLGLPWLSQICEMQLATRRISFARMQIHNIVCIKRVDSFVRVKTLVHRFSHGVER